MSRRLALLLWLFAACRQGRVAGTGVACHDDEDCRAGYQCLAGACRASLPLDAAASLDLEPGWSPDAAAEPDGQPDAAWASEAGAPDASASGTPSLARCTEYAASGAVTVCDRRRPPGAGPNSGAFSPDGTLFVSSGEDGTIRAWDVDGASLKLARTFPGMTYNVVLSPDGNLLPLDGDPVGVVHLATGAPYTTFPAGAGGFVRAVGFDSGGKRLTILTDTSIRIWSLQTMSLERDIQAAVVGMNLKREPAVESDGHWWLLFSSQGSGSMPLQIMVIDLNEAGARPSPLVTPAWVGRTMPPRIALSPDGNTFALADTEGTWLWDVSDKKRPVRQPGMLRPPEPIREDDVTDLAFSSSGKYLLLGLAQSVGSRGEVVIYDSATRKPLAGRALMGSPRRVAFSPDERAIGVSLMTCGNVLYCRD